MAIGLTAWAPRPQASRLFKGLDEGAEVFFVDVADGDVAQVRVGPAGDVKAVDRLDRAAVARACDRQRKFGDGDQMLAAAIDERRRRDPVDDGDAPAFEREALLGKVGDLRADRHAAGEPWLDRVPVGGGDVERLARDFGAREIGDEAGGDVVGGAWRPQRHDARADSEGDGGDRSGERENSGAGPGRSPNRRRRRRRRRRQRRDAVGERARRGFARSVAADRVPRRRDELVLRRKRRVGAHLALEFKPIGGVELAVESRIEP